jgi:TRAP-type C4-dicarboxylate transport system substrate-binding protein
MKRERKVKRIVSVLTMGAMLVPIMLCLLSTSALPAEKPIELRYTTTVTSIHPNFKASQEFADEVNKRTGGKVHITVFPSGTLNPPFETFNAIKTGIAQIGAAAVGYSAQIMPLNKLFGDALMGIPTAKEASGLWTMALKNLPELKDEFEGLHLLWVNSTLPLSIGTSKKPINKLEDFKGLVMRFPPGLEPLAKTWGVSPISIAPGDLYVALQKGIVEGFMGGSEMLKAMRLAEYIKYITSVSMAFGISYTAMNIKTWESLPPDVQKVFNDLTEWAQALQLRYTEESEKESLDFAFSQGCKLIKIDKAEIDRIHQVSKPVFEKMAADLEARGKPAKKVLSELERLTSHK